MTFRSRLLAVAGAALLLCTSAFAAAADTTTVTVEVREPFVNGTFDAGFWGAWFDGIESSATADQQTYGYIYMYVEDKRGTDTPWEVQFTMSDFTGGNTGGVISASGMTYQAAQIYDYWYYSSSSHDYYDPALQTFDTTTGIWSASGNQTGMYYTYLPGQLTIPMGTAADYYTSTLTLDVTSAP